MASCQCGAVRHDPVKMRRDQLISRYWYWCEWSSIRYLRYVALWCSMYKYLGARQGKYAT